MLNSKKVRINRQTFEFLLEKISPKLEKTPTNLNSDPIEPRCQLGLTLYRLGHGSSYTTIEDLFGVYTMYYESASTGFLRI